MIRDVLYLFVWHLTYPFSSFFSPYILNILLSFFNIFLPPSSLSSRTYPFLSFHLLHFIAISISFYFYTYLTNLLTDWPLLSLCVSYFYFYFCFYFCLYCRIINVSSTAHLLGNLEAVREKEDLMLSKAGAYEPWPAYGIILLTILYTLLL